MTIKYKVITPSPIPNAIVKEVIIDNTIQHLIITPEEGYKLHDKEVDNLVLQPNLQLKRIPGYSKESIVRINYDFDNVNLAENNVFTYGNREFYCVKQ